ncbi:MAG: HEPN domain-containing protein [Promethearchaeota archaeon]
MKTNFTQAKSWISSAINDMKRVLNNLKMKDFSLVAFRSQFAVEKLNNALLNLLGVKIEKTHAPSKFLESILNDEKILIIDQKTRDLLKIIINNSRRFEAEGTKTRYGIRKNAQLTFPEDIYSSFDDIKEFIINLNNIIHNHVILLKETFNITENEFEDLKQLKKLGGELNK